MIIVILGMIALGAEITFVLYKHRQMQSAADSAALGGATALMRGYPADFTVEAHAIASSAGFINGVNNVTVAVNRPPTLGTHASSADAVEVIVSQPQYLGLVALFREGLFQVGARAVALIGNASLYCILALDPTAARALQLRENVIVGNPNCGAAANSNSDTALYMRNNASIKGPVSVHGNWSLSNNATLTGNPVTNHAATVTDPYADVTLESIPSCTGQTATASNNATVNLTPGHFCSGWDFKNNVTVNLTPGAYYIDKLIDFGNNVILNGTGGVTLIINGDYPVTFTNNAQVNITAPTSGPYAGLAFLGLRNAKSSVVHTFDNNTVMNIKGAVYFPNQIVEFNNNGATTPGGCTQVIGRIIRLYNNVWLDNNCDGTGVQPIASTASQLVE